MLRLLLNNAHVDGERFIANFTRSVRTEIFYSFTVANGGSCVCFIPDFGRCPDAGSAFYCANRQNERVAQQQTPKLQKRRQRAVQGAAVGRASADFENSATNQRKVEKPSNAVHPHKGTCRLEKSARIIHLISPTLPDVLLLGDDWRRFSSIV
jgi:hypothetical protein